MSPVILALVVGSCVLTAAFFVLLWLWMGRDQKSTQETAVQIQQEYDQALAEVQQRYGWQFQPPMDPQLQALYPYAAHREAKTAFAGQWRGRPFLVCNYWTQTEGLSNEASSAFGDGGRSTYTSPHWAVVMAIPADLPEMRLRTGSSVRSDKPTLLSRLSNPPPPLGDETFDRRFVVIAKDRSAIPAVFTPHVRQFVLADPRVPNADLGFWQSNICAEASGNATPMNFDKIPPKLDLLCDFLDQLYPAG